MDEQRKRKRIKAIPVKRAEEPTPEPETPAPPARPRGPRKKIRAIPVQREEEAAAPAATPSASDPADPANARLVDQLAKQQAKYDAAKKFRATPQVPWLKPAFAAVVLIAGAVLGLAPLAAEATRRAELAELSDGLRKAAMAVGQADPELIQLIQRGQQNWLLERREAQRALVVKTLQAQGIDTVRVEQVFVRIVPDPADLQVVVNLPQESGELLAATYSVSGERIGRPLLESELGFGAVLRDHLGQIVAIFLVAVFIAALPWLVPRLRGR